MKPLLLSLGLLAALFGQPGLAADPVISAQAAPTHVAVASQDLRLKSAATVNAPAQLAVVEKVGIAGSGRLVDASRAEPVPVDGLPSTPIALATLLLMICILVGRRNS